MEVYSILTVDIPTWSKYTPLYLLGRQAFYPLKAKK